ADVPDALVLSDTAVYWDKPQLDHHCPDVCVIFGVNEKRTEWQSFYVREQGTRPSAIIELVSPRVRVHDVVTKFKEYHLAEATRADAEKARADAAATRVRELEAELTCLRGQPPSA